MKVLEIQDLSKTFISGALRRKSYQAIKRVDLSMNDGEILVLMGPNGSGKTTLVKILSTLILPTTGQIKVGGFDAVRQPAAVRSQISLVNNEDRSFFWRLTCYENLRFFCILNNLSESHLHTRIDNLAQRLHLGDFLHKRFDCCSAGMKRRLAIARAILSRPKLLLLDEPNNSLDTESADAMKVIIKEQVESYGVSVIYITHHEEEVRDLNCRKATMIAGELHA